MSSAPEPNFPFLSTALKGKTAIVTGGNDGIGASITCALAKAGARVAVLARRREPYDDMVEANSILKDTSFFECDLSNAEDTKKGAKSALSWAGGSVDILVNNAGIALLDPLEELSIEKWDKTMAVNSRAPFLMAQACAPGMIAKKSGKIINIGSQAGTIGLQDHGAYCASKGAVDALTRVMAVEWSKHNIQCNSIGPTVVMTEMGKRVWGGPAGDPMRQRTPLGRFAEPFEVANMVVYLCTGASNIICGQTILMEGGITIS